jgi:hypothetical protein
MEPDGRKLSAQDCAPISHPERRLETRHPVDTSAVIYLVDLAAKVQGRILDLSLHGCCIRTDQRFALGIFRRVETEFCLEGLPFRLAGVTQALYEPCKIGIRFLDMSERKQEQLLQLIEEIDELHEREKAASAQDGSFAQGQANQVSPGKG